MSLFSFFAGVSSWFASLTGLQATQQAAPVVRRVVIEDTIILKVPVRPMRTSRPIEWIEEKGPKCLPARAIAGATLSGPSSIDFVLRDRRRIRAKLDDDCPALDFYSGFYLQANEDELICAKREMIRSRIGGSCRIARFRRLEPQAKR